ncbi:MAG: hypothetical protein V1747_09950 [Candidatus Omnitrophota bacterium]
MPDENLNSRQQDDKNLEKKLEMDCTIALKIYRVLKTIQDELNAAEGFVGKGNAEKDWSYRTIERKDVWAEKTNSGYKTVHKFSYRSKYDIYFIVYGCGKGITPYVEINKNNEVLFKAEVAIETLKFSIKIAKYDLQDEWYKALLNHFFAFESEAESKTS